MVAKELFQRYVEFLKENDPSRRPTWIYENYDFSGSHATIARCFIIHFRKSHPELVDDAICLMKDAVEKVFTEKDEEGQIDVDQIIWGYNDLSVWYGSFKKDMENALQFANKGIEILETTADRDLCFGVRGQLWFNRWVTMLRLTREEEALKECRAKINEIRLRNLNYTSNSMLYYSFQFLAFVAKEHKEVILAIEQLQEAAKYIDLQDEVRKYELKKYHEILKLKETDPEECYNQLDHLLDMVSSLHQAWDFDPSLLEE